VVGVTGVPNLGFPFVAMVKRLLGCSHVPGGCLSRAKIDLRCTLLFMRGPVALIIPLTSLLRAPRLIEQGE
jgi:hypothetical protein